MPLFPSPLPHRSKLRQKLFDAYVSDEKQTLEQLLKYLPLSTQDQSAIEKRTISLIQSVRQLDSTDPIESLMMHYSLSSEEGILLMCLAEALLRIPDKKTQDLLIKDKLSGGDWDKHLKNSESRFVHLAAFGLTFTGKVVKKYPNKQRMHQLWYGLLNRVGEPIIRDALRRTMKAMSEHFVLGNDIQEALENSKKLSKQGYYFSYDMLGEMARTYEQANDYFKAYQKAIDAVAASIEHNSETFAIPTISVKISALHPRYEFSHRESVIPLLVKQLKMLALQAKAKNIHLTVDAEEAARLDISLDIFEQVFCDPDLANWPGLGLAVQAYQKRCFALVEYLIQLARQENKKIGVRLVKGAYWDTEIKISQVEGFDDYPVFTRKAATDVSYLACAAKLIEASDVIYAKFATHNAYTTAAILQMVKGKNIDFEFQRLQGMGEALHNVLIEQHDVHSRIYAPVGKHEDLLPYLVRRLLENGANSSFVHQIADPNVPVESLAQSPIEKVKEHDCNRNTKIPLPESIYPNRANSEGFDITREDELAVLNKHMHRFENHHWSAGKKGKNSQSIHNPGDLKDEVGTAYADDENELEKKLHDAQKQFIPWNQLGIETRAMILEKMGDLLQRDFAELLVLLRRESGKVFKDAASEIREAIDYCHYYALQARQTLSPLSLVGPTGESNTLYQNGRGVMMCISPWNFPLAIFLGQVAASLVAGNCVLAKPAGQTPLIAAKTIELLHEAGVPKEVVQLVIASGSMVDKILLSDERVKGVLFTGSTSVAKTIQRTLAEREGEIVPLIAETGGINAMILDSSALLEQAVMDVMQSAFGSAGQRCSALRLLCVQSDIADDFLNMLVGAMKTWRVGDPSLLSTDVGPVIDIKSHSELSSYVETMYEKAAFVGQVDLAYESLEGHFISPCVFELPDIGLLNKEVFGPILHVVRFNKKELHHVVDQINVKGYGLTFGIQTRIDITADDLEDRIRVGNIYVNRSMIGAVVGVQPFGGCGLSGTGPKAGGPHYLLRVCRETTVSINTTATGGNAQLLKLEDD